jgi:glycosyltransferase involved in cell wall biosynthesis
MAEQAADLTSPLGVAGRPLRVALVLGTSTGGVGRHVAALARGLAHAGADVAVLGPASTDRMFEFAAGGDRAGARAAHVESSERGRVRFRPVEIGHGLRPLAAVRAAVALRRSARRADVVHAHGFRAAAVTASALRASGFVRARPRGDATTGRRPVLVVTFHNAMLGSPMRRFALSRAMGLVARCFDDVLVVSGDLAAGLHDRTGRAPVRALVAAPPAHPAAALDAVRAGLGVREGTTLVVAVGRLHEQKGFDVLVDAAALLTTRGRPVCVRIAGDGPQRARLEALSAASGADVRLLGARSDVADLLAAADVVAMPSRWEGSPMVAAEALTAGAPLVVTGVGGLPDLVGEAALLVPAGDAVALAAAIASVADDPALAARLRASARTRAAQLPSVDDVTAQIADRYARLVRVAR